MLMRLAPPRATGPPTAKTKRHYSHPSSAAEQPRNNVLLSSSGSFFGSENLRPHNFLLEPDNDAAALSETANATASYICSDSFASVGSNENNVVDRSVHVDSFKHGVSDASLNASPRDHVFCCKICRADHSSTPRANSRKRKSTLGRRGLPQEKIFIASEYFMELPVVPVSERSNLESTSFVDASVYTAFNEPDEGDAIDNTQNCRQRISSAGDTFNDHDDAFSENQGKVLLSNDLPETTTCINVPGGFYRIRNGDLFKSSELHDSRTDFHFNITQHVTKNLPQSEESPRLEHLPGNDGHSANSVQTDGEKEVHHRKVRKTSTSPSRGRHVVEIAMSKERTNPARIAKSSKASREKENDPAGRRRPGMHQQRTKSYGLLFVLYLLALPILCATSSSPQIAAAFAQTPPLTHGQNFSQRNSSMHLQGNQQGVAESQGHPYNQYSWEVNRINPWLSACDLAGPAPADLQGTCGPPEVPKNCPGPCEGPARGKDIYSEVVRQLEGNSRAALRSSDKAFRNSCKQRNDDGRSRSESGLGEQTAPEQCLFYLEESHKNEICRDDFGLASSRSCLTVRENRFRFLSGLRLRHCCENAAVNALAPGWGGPLEDVLGGGTKCKEALDKLLTVDVLAARLHCEFGEVLARYDCAQPYSVIHNCTHCKEAYRRWVCSSLVPYFAHEGPPDLEGPRRIGAGMRIRPCRSFCQSVEQRCPYLLPGDRAPAYPTQYAGEPTFLCRDPNIPEIGEQAARALHGSEDKECCFHACSEDYPGWGVCANCTESNTPKRSVGQDPPTAPQCEITGKDEAPPSTGQREVDSKPSVQGTSFCGTGGVGSMSSAAPRIAPLPILCLFWVWGALISLCTGTLARPTRSPECLKNLTALRKLLRPRSRTMCSVLLCGSALLGIGSRVIAELRSVCFELFFESEVKWPSGRPTFGQAGSSPRNCARPQRRRGKRRRRKRRKRASYRSLKSGLNRLG